ERVDITDRWSITFIALLQRFGDVAIADLKRRIIFAADQLLPGQVGTDPRLDGVCRNAGAFQHLTELRGGNVLPAGHTVESAIHLGTLDLKTINLGTRDFEPIINQIIDDLLASRGFV